MSSYDSVANTPAPMGDDALRKTAASQIDLEINQSVAPIQSQINTAQAREDRSLGQIGAMFNNLQPVVNQGAQAVQASYDQATSNEQQVYAQAQANLQKLRGNRAGDAQAMSQMIGGPVAISEWTQPFDDASQDLTYLGAGQQLNTMLYAQAGVQQANQFASQVMPLVRTEQMASVRNQFEDQIREYEDQITSLKSQKGAQVNKRYNELRTQELQYGLDRARVQLQKLDDKKNYNLEVQKTKTAKAQADRQYRLDKQTLGMNITKANRDYELALRAAGNDDKRVKLAQKNFDLDMAQITGKFGGKPTLAAVTEAHRAHEAMVTAGLSAREITAREGEIKANTKIETQKLQSAQQTQWVDIMENAIHPQMGKDITTTVAQVVPANSVAMLTDPTVYQGKDGRYYKNVEIHQSPPSDAITDPNRLVDYLVTAINDPKSMTRARATELVRSRLGLGDTWKYGDPDPRSAAEKAKAGGDSTKTTTGTGAQGQGSGDTREPGPTTSSSPGIETYKPTNTPDPKKTYYTPAGPMKIADAMQIASGAVEATEKTKNNMYNWLIKQGFPLPEIVDSAGKKTAKRTTQAEATSDNNTDTSWVPLTKLGKFDLGQIRRMAAKGDSRATAWLSARGYSK